MNITDLEAGQLHLFSNFAAAAVPKNIAGVYTVWEGDQFIYVGIGGTGIRYTEPSDEAEPSKPVARLRGRLNQHRSGDRSGDKFCIYVCDRFVLPSLTTEQIHDVGASRLSPGSADPRLDPRPGTAYATSKPAEATRPARSRTRSRTERLLPDGHS